MRHYLAKGMMASITVQPASGVSGSEPTADMTVRLEDYTFELPEVLTAGSTNVHGNRFRATFQRELSLLQLA